jgi:hypothetical protein
MAQIEVVLGVDAALVLKYGDANQAVVKGLNKMTLPGLSRSIITVSEFRRDFAYEVTGEGKYGQIGIGGNLLLGDTKGQDQLKAYLKSNTGFSDARLYLDLNDFLACDLANDPTSLWKVAEITPVQTDKNGNFTIDAKMVVSGDFAYFTVHKTAITLAFASTGNKVTDSGSGFVTAGFEVGQTLIVEDTTSNDGQYLITAVAAGELTLDSTVKAVTTEAAGTSVTLHAGRL